MTAAAMVGSLKFVLLVAALLAMTQFLLAATPSLKGVSLHHHDQFIPIRAVLPDVMFRWPRRMLAGARTSRHHHTSPNTKPASPHAVADGGAGSRGTHIHGTEEDNDDCTPPSRRQESSNHGTARGRSPVANPGIDTQYGAEKRTVPTGSNPLHN